MLGEDLRVLALLISSTIDQVSLEFSSLIQYLLTHLADPIFLPLLMYDVCGNHFKILCMTHLLGLLNHVCNLGILMLELLSILIGTRRISVTITRYILTLFRAGIRH